MEKFLQIFYSTPKHNPIFFTIMAVSTSGSSTILEIYRIVTNGRRPVKDVADDQCAYLLTKRTMLMRLELRSRPKSFWHMSSTTTNDASKSISSQMKHTALANPCMAFYLSFTATRFTAIFIRGSHCVLSWVLNVSGATVGVI